MKKCPTCKETKLFSDFSKNKSKKDGFTSQCKACVSHHHKDTSSNIKEKQKEWRSKNFTKLTNKHSNYYQQNKIKLNEYNSSYKKNRISKDPKYKLTRLLRSRLNGAIKKGYKSGSAVKDLGCSIEFLKQYLESKFQPGMSWGNQGDWHIDHIIPLSNFELTNKEELLKACNYTNLQPLWAIDNLKKGHRIEA